MNYDYEYKFMMITTIIALTVTTVAIGYVLTQ